MAAAVIVALGTLATRRDGKIVVADRLPARLIRADGSTIRYADVALTRYLPNGAIDRTFAATS